MNEVMDSTLWGLLGSGLFILLGWLYQRRNTSPDKHFSNSVTGYKSKNRSLWYRNRFNPALPNVPQYGGKPKANKNHPALLTTEYSMANQVNTQYVSKEAFQFSARKHLLTPQEHSIFNALKVALDGQPYQVFPKVRLMDVLEIPNETSLNRERQAALERIHQKHIDFVICHAQSSEIVGAILLDSSDQHRLGSKIHHKFIETTLSSVKIPVLHIPVKPTYQIDSLNQILNHSLGTQLPTTLPSTMCPKCGASLRKAKDKTGRLLRVCSRYPTCRTLLPLKTEDVS